MGRIEDLDELRGAFLVAVFEATGGSPDESCAQSEVEARLGITHELAEDVFEYLWKQGLVEPKFMGGQIGLTHAGRMSVEGALREAPPSKPVGLVTTAGGSSHNAGPRHLLDARKRRSP